MATAARHSRSSDHRAGDRGVGGSLEANDHRAQHRQRMTRAEHAIQRCGQTRRARRATSQTSIPKRRVKGSGPARDVCLCRHVPPSAHDASVSGNVVEAIPAGVQKREVLEELGESTLLLPALVASGWRPTIERSTSSLSFRRPRARRLSVDATSVDARGASRRRCHRRRSRFGGRAVQADGTELVHVPNAGLIHARLIDAIDDMLRPLDAARLEDAPDHARLRALATEGPDATSEVVLGTYVDRMTSADRQSGDSLHLLVMDAHRALNRLQAQVAPSSIAGASAYGLTLDDEGLVRAFMAGLHETAPLKFDHPGLTASATRVRERLLIENDLGTTNAHVVVLAVEELAATVTYTDVHPRRLAFFQSMLDRFPVAWSDAERRLTMLGEHHVAIGRYDAPDRAALEQYLQYVGSRLVFVLDWNRARKRLTPIVGRNDALRLLRWAATRTSATWRSWRSAVSASSTTRWNGQRRCRLATASRSPMSSAAMRRSRSCSSRSAPRRRACERGSRLC